MAMAGRSDLALYGLDEDDNAENVEPVSNERAFSNLSKFRPTVKNVRIMGSVRGERKETHRIDTAVPGPGAYVKVDLGKGGRGGKGMEGVGGKRKHEMRPESAAIMRDRKAAGIGIGPGYYQVEKAEVARRGGGKGVVMPKREGGGEREVGKDKIREGGEDEGEWKIKVEKAGEWGSSSEDGSGSDSGSDSWGGSFGGSSSGSSRSGRRGKRKREGKRRRMERKRRERKRRMMKYLDEDERCKPNNDGDSDSWSESESESESEDDGRGKGENMKKKSKKTTTAMFKEGVVSKLIYGVYKGFFSLSSSIPSGWRRITYEEAQKRRSELVRAMEGEEVYHLEDGRIMGKERGGKVENGEVRLDEERSDELITLALGMKITHARTFVQDAAPHQSPQ